MALAICPARIARPSTFFTVALFASHSFANQLFTLDMIPGGLSSTCVNALLADVPCGSGITSFTPGEYYALTDLKELCVDSCASSLATYHDGVASSCAADVWSEGDLVDAPIAMISEMIRYNYNVTCMTDNGRFCNNVAAAYLASIDPGMADLPEGLPAGGDFGDYVPSDTCDNCFIKKLRFQASSPYYDGPKLQSESVYEAKTSSCGVANIPLMTTTISLYSPTTIAPSPTPTCDGTTYTIRSGDSCNSISLSQKIGTEWLLWDNNLFAHCAQFPSEGDLCLVNTCEIYTVLETDTCDSIAKEHDISVSQLMAWNPVINAGCYNLNQTIGDQLCVSKPGDLYVSPAPTTLQPSIPTTAAPVPTDVADQTNTYCGKYYQAVLGDYCNLIIMKFGISLSDFLFLNPAVNEECTNLYAEESYCVQPVGDINTYPGKAGHITFTLTMTSGVEDSATNLPDVAWSAPTATTTVMPFATGTREDCYQYMVGDDWQRDLSGSALSSNCRLVAAVYDVTLEDLEVWNPSLGNASEPGCSFESGVRYCAKWYEGQREYDEPDSSDSSYPARDGMTEDCLEIVDVDETGYPSCQTILEDYQLTIAQFYDWNPSVGADCSGLWAGYHYCILASDYIEPSPTTIAPSSQVTTATTAATSGSANPTPPGPTHAGQPENCNQWHLVQAGDGCSTVEAQYGLTHAEFLLLNPAVSQDCTANFWGGYAYCVGTSASSVPNLTTTTPVSTPTNGPVAAPEPNQAGNAVSSCNKYAQAQAGDWCSAFADRHGIAATNLYLWNTILGSSGENCGSSFWLGYWYCIGVAS